MANYFPRLLKVQTIDYTRKTSPDPRGYVAILEEGNQVSGQFLWDKNVTKVFLSVAMTTRVFHGI